MMRGFLITSATVALLALPAVAGAAPRQISAGDDFFSPKKPAARSFEAGASFHWSRAGGSSNRHNIRQDDKLFFSGHATSGPINYTINASAGSFHYYCEIHRFSGMSGVGQGPSARHPRLGGRRDSRPVGRLRHQHRLALRRRATGSTTGSGSSGRRTRRKFQGTFGHNDSPVNFNLNRHTYKIEVRSERKQVSKRSDWSPALTLHD